MTTNKPEVKRYDCTSGGSAYCYGCYTMSEDEGGEYVEWEDYEALQAECEKQRNDLMDALRAAREFIRNQKPRTTKLPDGKVRLGEDLRPVMRILWKIDAALTGCTEKREEDKGD